MRVCATATGQGLTIAAAVGLSLLLTQARAAAPVPRVMEVPIRPAFVRPPGGKEIPARSGQILAPTTLLRTEKPGRLQVKLANGRNFRLGGDAVLRLAADGLSLEKGQIIAWVNPSQKGGSPLKIRTRVATTSIVGTTVFIDATAESLKVFSWEGLVRVETDRGRTYELRTGEQLSLEKGHWQPVRRLSQPEAAARRDKSILLNGFSSVMETMPAIEQGLGLTPQPVRTVGP